MKLKIVRNYVDWGCCFPVTIEAVAIGNYRGNVIPLIDYDELDRKVLYAVASLPHKLTGAHIRFIQAYAEESFADFAAHFGVTVPTVVGWEKRQDHSANINFGTESLIRVYALHLAGAKPQVMADLLMKRILDRDKVTEPDHTSIRVSINTDPSTFGKHHTERKTKRAPAPATRPKAKTA